MAGIPENKLRHRNKIEQHEHCDIADARRTKLVDEDGNPINDSNPLSVNATLTGAAKAKNPLIVRVDMPLADTEYSYQFPLNTDQFSAHPELNKVPIKYAFILGESGTDYDKIKPGNVLRTGDLKLSGTTTIYFQSSVANNTMIFKVWTL